MPPGRPLLARAHSTLARLATFRTVTVALYEHARDPGLEVGARLERVTSANVADALAMDPPELVERFRTFLARGDMGWYAYLGDRVVHRTWMRRGPCAEPAWLAWGRIAVAPGEAYVHFCETAPAARGHGLYPAIILHAARTARAAGATRVLISTTLDNAASVRGIARAGYVEVQRRELRVRFGFAAERGVAAPPAGESDAQ